MNKWTALSLSFVLSGALQAEPLEVVGSIPVVISNSNQSKSYIPLIVYVQKINLSPDAQYALRVRVDKVLNDKADNTLSALPARVDLGMNNTPVLDQGDHGSCVTFAMTGALDAIIGQGDYVSQLCSLELGAYLVKIRKARFSGWEGSRGELVLNQHNTYGFFPISYQKKYGCAGVTKYPLSDQKNTGNPMTISEYTANSQPLSSYASWKVLVTTKDAFTINFKPDSLLSAVKNNLSQGKRTIFGMLLDDTQGDAGALGTNKKSLDTWVFTESIKRKAQNGTLKAGHAMIILGYDDNAIAHNSDGTTSQGLLIVRNSWGARAGDRGTYYVSYDYFKALCDDAQVIIPAE